MTDTPENPINEILSPLSNETRRRILLVIGENEPIMYSEILEITRLESGSFYWHASKMSHLITQNAQKHYILTEKGRLAYKLLVNSPLETEGSDQQSMLEVWTENLGVLLFHTKSWRLGFELLLLYALWGLILSMIKGVQVLFVTEVYTDPPSWVSLFSPVINAFLLAFLTSASMIILQQFQVITPPKDSLSRSSPKPRFYARYGLQIMFSFSSFLLSSSVIYVFYSSQGWIYSVLVSLISFFSMLLFLLLYSAATLYSFNVRIKDIFLLILVTSYVLFALSYYLSGVLPY